MTHSDTVWNMYKKLCMRNAEVSPAAEGFPIKRTYKGGGGL